jgi:hypothetical protein
MADALQAPEIDTTKQAAPTNAEAWCAREERGRWRTAAKEHGCDHFWSSACLGNGLIAKGDRYFDTELLREYTKGPIPFRCCATCAAAPESR